MQCDQCESSATVHLTEVVQQLDGTRGLKEVHLCLAHAIERGVISGGLGMMPEALAEEGSGATAMPASIVPAMPLEQGMVLAKSEGGRGDAARCPTCGTTWQDFRRSGLMGCPGDYVYFETRLLPLLKKAQEQNSRHVGKPLGGQPLEPGQARALERQRLHRELDRALADEQYEAAARLRDQLRMLGDSSR